MESITKISNARQDHASGRQFLVNLSDIDLELLGRVVLDDTLQTSLAGNEAHKYNFLDAPLFQGLNDSLSGSTSGDDGVENKGNVIGLISLGQLVVVLNRRQSALLAEQTKVIDRGLSGRQEVQER